MQRSPCNYLIFILLTGFAFACENDLEDINRVQSFFYNVNTETAKNVEILYSDSANVRVRVKGPVMLYHIEKSNPHQEFTEGMEVDFFGPDGKVTSTLTSKYGVRYETKSQVIARDSVVWQSTQGDKLETEELIWDETTKKVFTHKFAVISRPDEILYGHGFESNQDFSYSRIVAVEGRINVKKENR